MLHAYNILIVRLSLSFEKWQKCYKFRWFKTVFPRKASQTRYIHMLKSVDLFIEIIPQSELHLLACLLLFELLPHLGFLMIFIWRIREHLKKQLSQRAYLILFFVSLNIPLLKKREQHLNRDFRSKSCDVLWHSTAKNFFHSPGALVDLLSALVELQPSLCESGHVVVLLAAYNASLTSAGENLHPLGFKFTCITRKCKKSTTPSLYDIFRMSYPYFEAFQPQ